MFTSPVPLGQSEIGRYSHSRGQQLRDAGRPDVEECKGESYGNRGGMPWADNRLPIDRGWPGSAVFAVQKGLQDLLGCHRIQSVATLFALQACRRQ